MNLDDYLGQLTERARANGDKQATYHQQLALDLAKEFDDMKHKGIYFKICKDYPAYRIINIRDKVRRVKNPRNKGALFVAMFFKKNNENTSNNAS